MSNVTLIDKECVAGVIGGNMALVKQAVLEALRSHYEGAFEQPAKVYLQESDHAHTADRIIAMPAHIKSRAVLSGIKWIGSKHTNPQIGLNRASALIVLNDPATNVPLAILDGTLISAMRTTAVSLIAIDRLRPALATVAVLGMGRLGHLHARTLVQEFPTVRAVRCFSEHAPFDDLIRESDRIVRCNTFGEAVRGADVVITTTTANSPYIEPEHVPGNPLLINLSLMDFTIDVFTSSDIVVDDWRQCRLARKVLKTGIDQGLVLQADTHELSEVLFGSLRQKQFPGRTIVNPLGMAIEDLMVAWEVYQVVHSRGSLPVLEIE